MPRKARMRERNRKSLRLNLLNLGEGPVGEVVRQEESEVVWEGQQQVLFHSNMFPRDLL